MIYVVVRKDRERERTSGTRPAHLQLITNVMYLSPLHQVSIVLCIVTGDLFKWIEQVMSPNI